MTHNARSQPRGRSSEPRSTLDQPLRRLQRKGSPKKKRGREERRVNAAFFLADLSSFAPFAWMLRLDELARVAIIECCEDKKNQHHPGTKQTPFAPRVNYERLQIIQPAGE